MVVGTRKAASRQSSASAILATLVGLVALGAAVVGQRAPTVAEVEQANRVAGTLETQAQPATTPSASASGTVAPPPQPTSIPATAVPTAAPTPAPPSPTPRPTATAAPVLPETPQPVPLEPSPGGEFSPQVQPGGEISVTLRGTTSLVLPRPLPVQVYDGHAIVYLDDSHVGEVDLLVPYRSADGQRLFSYDDVLDHIAVDAKFREFSPPLFTEVNGVRAASYFGIANEFELGFITSQNSATGESDGWFMPAQMWLWVLDGPGGPIVVTGELLSENPREAEVSALLDAVLQSIVFHS